MRDSKVRDRNRCKGEDEIRRTPPISRLWIGVLETAIAEETAAVTMVVNFISKTSWLWI